MRGYAIVVVKISGWDVRWMDDVTETMVEGKIAGKETYGREGVTEDGRMPSFDSNPQDYKRVYGSKVRKHLEVYCWSYGHAERACTPREIALIRSYCSTTTNPSSRRTPIMDDGITREQASAHSHLSTGNKELTPASP